MRLLQHQGVLYTRPGHSSVVSAFKPSLSVVTAASRTRHSDGSKVQLKEDSLPRHPPPPLASHPPSTPQEKLEHDPDGGQRERRRWEEMEVDQWWAQGEQREASQAVFTLTLS